jgi:hypothetical protein
VGLFTRRSFRRDAEEDPRDAGATRSLPGDDGGEFLF